MGFFDWLTDDILGFNPNPPVQQFAPPPSPETIAAQQRAQQEAAQAAAAAQARTTAEQTARTGAQSYFSQRGLDPSQYQSAIDQRIAELMGTINPNDPTPGAQLQNIGGQVYGEQQDIARELASRNVSNLFPTNFEYGRIGETTDDPFIAQIAGEQRTKADDYLQNLLKRGVITQTGLQGGETNLDEQTARVNTLLNTLGGDILSSGRQSLTDIANRARTGASTLNLGQTFDPGAYGTEVSSKYDEFLKSLPDRLRASAPGDLYDTSGLAAIAGAAQGPQNLKFDPQALAGILSSDEEEQKRKQDEATSGATSRGVF